jgi:hypothetical protein
VQLALFNGGCQSEIKNNFLLLALRISKMLLWTKLKSCFVTSMTPAGGFSLKNV